MSRVKTYRDIDMSFKVHPIKGDVLVKEDEEAIKQQIETLLNLSFYDMVYHPELGHNIAQYLFSNVSSLHTQKTIEKAIELIIVQHVDRVKLNDIIVKLSQHNLEITLIFTIKNTNKDVTYTTFLRRVR